MTCNNVKLYVSFIYNLCYCLSQTCNPLQMDHVLYLRSNLINQKGIETEHVMGHTCSRRTLNNTMHKMSASFQIFCKWLIAPIIDDFTPIHTKRPQEEKLSETKTMCTIVVKAFKDILTVHVTHALCTMTKMVDLLNHAYH